MIFTEFNTGKTGEGSTILFKSGSKSQVLTDATASVGSDEEKAQTNTSPSPSVGPEDSNEKMQAMQGQMAKTFSWKNLSYAVSVSGEHRLLLDDVSGFVAPGKLTALMGESGAGKVLFFLCSRS